MKICNKCGNSIIREQEKVTRSRGKSYVRNTCKSCVNKQKSNHRRDNPRSYQRIDKQNQEYRKQQRQILLDVFHRRCLICGYSKCTAALDFHHIGPKKFGLGVSNMGKHIDVLFAELENTILLCANCHREIHNEYDS